MKGLSLSRFSRLLASTTGGLTALILFLLMMLVVVGVVMRYFLNQPLLIVDEFSGYMLATVTFLGLGYTLRAGGHVSVEVVISRLPRRALSWLDPVTSVIGLLYVSWFAWLAYKLVLDSYTIGTTYPSTLHTPLYIPQSVLPVGLALLGIQIVVEFLRKVKSSPRPLL